MGSVGFCSAIITMAYTLDLVGDLIECPVGGYEGPAG